MDEKTLNKIIFIAVAQLAKRVASFKPDEELGMETKQFGEISFTQEEVTAAFVKTNANYQEVLEDE